ncbi:fimbrial protein [Pseudomonas sp. CR3202]|uniref:fimbrial protein n=1 Tax=Pseudomonas sp. CR3202 TaxID=3351532 RepID=UPI003BF0A72A
MKKFSLAVLAMSVIAASGSALAVEAGKGQISFTGVINNDACSVEGSTGKEKAIAVDLGNISIKDLGTDTAPNAGRLSANDISLNINCNAGTKVSMTFDASKGSGVVDGKKVLKLTQGSNTAKNVGIAILDINGNVIDLTSGAATPAKIESTLNGGDATLTFAAAYVTTADPKTAVPGDGNATLPFTLHYE